MAIAASSPLQSVTTALYGRLRVQQAQHNAELAEQEARSLQASARAAQANADRAQEGARELQVKSDQASEHAGRARQGLAAERSSAERLAELGTRVGRVVEALQARDATPAPVATPAAAPATAVPSQPVLNADGQTTGTLISVSA